MNTQQRQKLEEELVCPFCERQIFGLKQRQILFAICVDNKNNSEIAASMGTKESTVRSQIRTIKKKIILDVEYFQTIFFHYDGFDLDKLGDLSVK